MKDVMTDRQIIEVLKQPAFVRQPGIPSRQQCSCGDIQTHQIVYCPTCGTKFEDGYDMKKISIAAATILRNEWYCRIRKNPKDLGGFHTLAATYQRDWGRVVSDLDMEMLCKVALEEILAE